MASQGTAISIGIEITHGCGCVEDHGVVSYSHPDPFIERHYLIDRLMNWHALADYKDALDKIKGMDNLAVHEYLKTLGHLFVPQSVRPCADMSTGDKSAHLDWLKERFDAIANGQSWDAFWLSHKDDLGHLRCQAHPNIGAIVRAVKGIAGAANVETWSGVSITNNRRHGSGTEPTNVGYGSGAGTSARTDTTLFTEFTTGTWTGYARLAATASLTTTTQTNDTWKLTGTTTNSSGGSVAITNLGNFDATSAGNLDVKGDFSTINLANSDSITPTITLQET